MPIVSLTNQVTFECQPGQTILDAARAQGIGLEHSCRNGRCGVCKTKVITGITSVTQPEISLAQDDMNQGHILTCCRTPDDHTVLDAEDLGEIGRIKVRTLPCRIDSLRRLNDDVIEVVLRLPPGTAFKFVPGQYVDIIYKNALRRSYSIANTPQLDGKIVLHIKKFQSGLFSDYWFNVAQKDDLLRLEGPFGTFSLRRAQSETLVFLATGTGIAPVKSILEQMDADNDLLGHSRIILYWGGRFKEDIYWSPCFKNIKISFYPTLSKDKDSAARFGYVQQNVIADAVDLKKAKVYACGSISMINDARGLLVAQGLNHKNFYSDAFVASN